MAKPLYVIIVINGNFNQGNFTKRFMDFSFCLQEFSKRNQLTVNIFTLEWEVSEEARYGNFFKTKLLINGPYQPFL